MGTFSVKMGTVSSRDLPPDSFWQATNGVPAVGTDAECIAAIDNNVDTLAVSAADGGAFPADDRTGIYEILFNPDSTTINLDTGFETYASLPLGFTVTSVTMNVRAKGDTSLDFDLLDGLTAIPMTADLGTALQQHTLAVTPTLVATFFGEYGWRWENVVPYATFGVFEFYLTGTYTIAGDCWYNETTDEYTFGADPGDGSIEVAEPTPRIDSITPDAGPTDGGTPVTLVGSGFINVIEVWFDDYLATALATVDDHTLTCVSPAHWQGAVRVIVTTDG
jgi:hypothetical protein